MWLGELDFIDDLAFLSHTQQQIQVQTINLVAVSALVDLKAQKGKRKTLECNTVSTNQISIDRKTLK